MKIYISGAITNNENYREEFAKAEARLLGEGHTVFSPVKNDGFTYKEYIDMGLNELMRCDAIYLLNGWMGSAGARLEFNYAFTVGMKIYCEGESLDENNSVRQDFETP